MGDKQRHFKLYNESPLYQLFVSFVIIFGVGITLSMILFLTGELIFGSDLTVLEKSAEALSDNDIDFLRYILIIQDISLFLVPSIIILVMMKPESSTGLSELKIPYVKEACLVVILAFCIFPITSFTGQLNAGMHLPESLSGVEKWMVEKEDQANNIINQVMISPAFATMILNLFIIAFLPAIAEEILFRGVLQKILYRLFKSGHTAIWVTAFIFSTIHFQFFGFVPRFILGLVFGYLFFWSGKLWLPVIAHFVNNAVPVVLAYIQGMQKFSEPADTPLLKQIILLPLPIAISLAILFYFRNKSRNINGSDDPEVSVLN